MDQEILDMSSEITIHLLYVYVWNKKKNVEEFYFTEIIRGFFGAVFVLGKANLTYTYRRCLVSSMPQYYLSMKLV